MLSAALRVKLPIFLSPASLRPGEATPLLLLDVSNPAHVQRPVSAYQYLEINQTFFLLIPSNPFFSIKHGTGGRGRRGRTGETGEDRGGQGRRGKGECDVCT